ncbi:hypothetical protein BS50DRAFT_664950 [Corynespora cassiicola Philippines]|uniref:F-box domain-containing protein n=1 Tax=Corynespora cassiicola Philippines TaxID=1448308 RepID=A0A2T2NQB5_CORCC|nr:hypothetical protein BS50DRAFT_664950 [Corynespora cassiicola Philippines]
MCWSIRPKPKPKFPKSKLPPSIAMSGPISAFEELYNRGITPYRDPRAGQQATGTNIDPRAELGTSRNPVRVYNMLTIPKTDTPCYIYSSEPLWVIVDNARLFLWAVSPIALGSCYSSVRIKSTAGLDWRFKRGFEKLPNELLLLIFGNMHFDPKEHVYASTSTAVMETYLFPFMRSTPKMGAISRQLFYETNSFFIRAHLRRILVDEKKCGEKIKGWDNPAILHSVLLPKPDARAMIRTLHIEVMLDDGISILRNFAIGKFGFPNIKKLTVRIDCEQFASFEYFICVGMPSHLEDRVALAERLLGNGIKFGIKGDLYMVVRTMRGYSDRVRMLKKDCVEIWNVLNDKIEFKDRDKNRFEIRGCEDFQNLKPWIKEKDKTRTLRFGE